MGTESNDHNDNDRTETMAELLDAYMKPLNQDIRVGDKINGEIISIGKDSVFVDTGTKMEGTVSRDELLNEKGELEARAGDRIDLYVVFVSDEEIRLSRAMSGIGGLDMLSDAYHSGIPVEGKVAGVIKGGFHVEVLQHRAFCPISQMDVVYVENPEGYVGECYPFKIIQFEDKGRNIVLSRRALLEEEGKKLEKAFFEELAVGAVLEGTVTRIMPYGVFVELVPGVEGMVHVSELSWSRVSTPAEAVSAGEKLKVKVIDIEGEDSGRRRKVSLSVKQTQDDPWDSVGDRFKAGEKVRGRVTRCAGFGAFVEIGTGIEGLVHISEMSYTKRVLKPEEILRPGDTVSVMIKEIDAEGRKVSLSLRDAEGDPWAEVPEKFRIGARVQGVVEKKEKFGLLISIEPGVTGLLPQSKINESSEAARIEKLKPGSPIPVIIREIRQQERKITFAPADGSGDVEWQQYSGKPSAGFGTLREKLEAALNRKKNS